MDIPDEAVDAGEWAVTNYLIAADEREHWGALDIAQEELRRVYLEAAAPFIAAEAWDDGYNDARDEHRDTGGFGDSPNPYREESPDA